ncbi:glycosyltransferase family 2 protein [uncultured Mucilaginibacter sp.]|uniref:glycosyltransferase family 2 protein n=1 Tax=uncultured Mucilaginibacter sp. TaxID=797541 RepID=UPI0026257265|nr:glycosyltransferase family 2 protein [uncultured Mucilaginibacter sp.]
MFAVSVIIPNYNHAKFLNKRIDSVLNQTYQNLELIILDDCSTDNSREIIEQYRNHSKVAHILFNETNSGSPFLQWQKGFELAKNDYLWIAESDDYADIRFLEVLLPCLIVNEKVGVAFADSNTVDAQDVIHPDFYKNFRNSRFKTDKWNYDYIKPGIDEIKENLFFECTINNTSAMVFKKNLLQYVNFDHLKNFRYCGDWFFFVSLLNHCDVAYKKEALNFFKYGTDNFKKGTRSVINYFKERFMVRYYFWKELKPYFSAQKRKQLYRELGIEMRIQLNEMLKRNSSFLETIQSFTFLYHINKSLFRRQFYNSLRAYIWKN